MSKVEILAELPKLKLEERREIFERIRALEDYDLLHESEPTAEEKDLLDRELAEYRRQPDAGSAWNEVVARIRQPARSELAGYHPPQSRGRFAGGLVVV